jgi:diaminopimelate decarboxylase
MSLPTDFFHYKKNALSVDGVLLSKIAEEVGTPAYVYSAEAFLSPLKELQRGLRSIDHLICFAVKANSNLGILKLLDQAGAGMDLVSGGELHRAGLAGVSSKKIVFSGVGKTPGEMASALEYYNEGILSFNVESAAEIEVLNAVALQLGKRAPVSLRYNPDVDAKTHPYISTGLKKNKFGIQRAEIIKIARSIGHYPGIDMRGISIHIGSQLLSLSPLSDAFSRVRDLADELNEILEHPLSVMDLGGGVGITYNKEKTPPIQKYCDLILKNFGPKAGLKHPVKVLIEPGRLLSGNSGVLLTEVLYRKANTAKDFLVVDAAMNDLLRPSLYGSYHEIIPVEKRSGKTRKTDIVGPVCETGDCFASDRPVSDKIKQGDLVAILSAGAYGFTMTSNYNSRPRPPEVLVQNGKFRVVRERETYDDLVHKEIL